MSISICILKKLHYCPIKEQRLKSPILNRDGQVRIECSLIILIVQ